MSPGDGRSVNVAAPLQRKNRLLLDAIIKPCTCVLDDLACRAPASSAAYRRPRDQAIAIATAENELSGAGVAGN